jgi:hypothetical protein
MPTATNQQFKKEFQVYKEGFTISGKIMILSKVGEPFNKKAKIKKYLSLGYQVFDTNNTEIKQA